MILAIFQPKIKEGHLTVQKIFLFLGFFLITQNLQASSLESSLKKLDQYVKQQIQKNNVMGCSIAVVDHGQIAFMKAYGLKKKGGKDKVDLNTAFQLGSASKPIAATLIALLKKQGLINLDASLNLFYPYLKPTTTLRHVLTHTTGFKRTGWNNKIENNVLRNQLLKDLETSVQGEPGIEFDYHNFVYSLMEGVVQATQNQRMDVLLYHKLFMPLGMNQTTIGYEAFLTQPNRAWPHQRNQKKVLYPSKSYSKLYHTAVFTAAGINSNIQDMASFLRLQLIGVPGLLNMEDLNIFHAPVIEANDALLRIKRVLFGETKSYYGMGWRIAETPKKRIVYHGGWVKGFCSFVGFLPDRKLGIVVLSNSETDFSLKTSLLFLHDWVR